MGDFVRLVPFLFYCVYSFVCCVAFRKIRARLYTRKCHQLRCTKEPTPDGVTPGESRTPDVDANVKRHPPARGLRPHLRQALTLALAHWHCASSLHGAGGRDVGEESLIGAGACIPQSRNS